MDSEGDTIPEGSFREGDQEVYISLYHVQQDTLGVLTPTLVLTENMTMIDVLDNLIGSASDLPDPTKTVTKNIDQINRNLLGHITDIVVPTQINNATAFDSKFHVLYDWTSWLNISGMGQYRVIIKLPAPDTRYNKLIVFDNAGSVFICKADATTSYISLVRTI
jgi:hypothetical protein